MKMPLAVCIAIVSTVSAAIESPMIAETKQNQVQQLYATFFEGAERQVCFNTPDTNRPIAVSQRYRPEQGDDELTLVVYSEEESLLNDCPIGAFESLRNATFEMGIEPPRVRVIHYVTDQIGNVISSSRKVYQCSVPAQRRDHRTDLNYDTAYNLGSFHNLCR